MTSEEKTGKRISLVLGSGGARGLAHIGVIHWLEEHGYEIVSLVGCSMGACIGGIHATGKLSIYEEWVRAIRKRHIVSLMDVTFRKGGLLKGDRLFTTLRELLGEHQIEDLPIKFTAVAVDINKSREVWLTEGPMFDAIRASTSIPLLFTPANVGDRKLIDGAVMNPIPIAPTVGDHTDLVIAVNVSGELTEGVSSAAKIQVDEDTHSETRTGKLQERIVHFLEGMSSHRSAHKEEEESITDVVYTAFDAMQSTIARQKLAAYPPDILIDIPRNVASIMEFDRAEELIELGYTATERTMNKAPLAELSD
ncbi:MAG: patatin-like phospholipase family protein [Acidiferrobacterales bacterium]|nr:patatin-like phospholipase family protein [Acidiferrobacterales bacterium]